MKIYKIGFFIAIVIIAIFIVYHTVETQQISIPLSTTVIDDEFGWVREYVTTDDEFVDIATTSALSSGGLGSGAEEDDMLTVEDTLAIQKWVSSNIQYKDIEPAYPNATFKSREGDCFNMVTLEFSIILNEANDDDLCGAYILLLDVETSNNQTARHCAIMVTFPSGIILSDPTIESYAIDRLCTLDSPENAINTIIDGTDVVSYDIDTAVSLNEHHLFDSNIEFIEWAEVQMEIC